MGPIRPRGSGPNHSYCPVGFPCLGSIDPYVILLVSPKGKDPRSDRGRYILQKATSILNMALPSTILAAADVTTKNRRL